MWRLCDFHNHTTPNEQCDAEWDAERFVHSCLDAGLDVVAVTDHDHCDHLADAVRAAEATPLVVVPGVELSTDHGHILVLSPGDGGIEVVSDFCKRVGMVPDQQIKFETLVGAFDSKHDAERFFSDEIVLIGAHVDAPGSLLSTQNTRSVALQLEAASRLHALEIAGADRFEEWLRDGVKQSDRGFTLVRGSDTHDPSARVDRATWIYLPDVTVDHLRHALALPESSVLVADEAPHTQECVVEYVEFEGGHHSGDRFDFVERANAIIGPPNAGKSLLIDALKFAFGADCEIEEVERITQARMKRTMPEGTIVRVGIRTPDGASVIERTVGGSDQPSVPFKPIIFSQTELTRRSIAREPAIQLLDIHCPDVGNAKAAIRAAADVVSGIFVQLCEDAGRCRSLRAKVENPEDGLAATKKDIGDLSGHESVAAKAINLEKVAGWQADTAGAVEAWLGDLVAEPLPIPPMPELADERLDLDSLVPVDELRTVAEEAHQRIAEAVASAQRDLDDVLAPAAERLEEQRESADQELEEHGFEKGSELLDAVRRLQTRLGRLQQDKTQLDGLEHRINDGLVELRAALADVQKARFALTDLRKAGCTRVNESMHSFLAKLDPTGATSTLEALFDDLKTGTKMHPATRKRALDGLDRMRFMERAVRELQGQPLADDDRYSEQDRVVAEALDRDKHADLATLSCCYPGDTLDLMWKEERPPRPFTGLTEGLRALAIKEISFAASSLPVITDQPEDAVPTRSVFTSLVPTLRQQRQSRQFIVVSHDANIVVTSDLERIIVLGANDDGSHASGGLFDPAIQAAALEHLEGGRQAFMLRSDRYGKAKS